MKERELANLLIQMGVDSGLDVERTADQLAGLTLPAFVDSRAFRSALLESVETQLRRQVEQRLQAMRQKFDVAAAPVGAVNMPSVKPSISSMPSAGNVVTPVPAPPANPILSPMSDQGAMDTFIGDLAEDDEPMSDDTIVWSPRRD